MNFRMSDEHLRKIEIEIELHVARKLLKKKHITEDMYHGIRELILLTSPTQIEIQ